MLVVPFLADGSRVPTFTDKLVTDSATHRILRHGYRKAGPPWKPHFVATRWGKRHWRLWHYGDGLVSIPGSISDAALHDTGRNAYHPVRRWPNLASIEMYLRMKRP